MLPPRWATSTFWGKNWIFDAFFWDLIGRSLLGATFLGSKKAKLAISLISIFSGWHLCGLSCALQVATKIQSKVREAASCAQAKDDFDKIRPNSLYFLVGIICSPTSALRFRLDGKHFQNGSYWKMMSSKIVWSPCPNLPQTQIQNDCKNDPEARLMGTSRLRERKLTVSRGANH